MTVHQGSTTAESDAVNQAKQALQHADIDSSSDSSDSKTISMSPSQSRHGRHGHRQRHRQRHMSTTVVSDSQTQAQHSSNSDSESESESDADAGFEECLTQLVAAGHTRRGRNIGLLHKFHGDVNAVIQHLKTRQSSKTKIQTKTDKHHHRRHRHSKTPSVATDSSSDSESDSSNSALRARINTIAPEDRKMRSCLWKLTMRGYVKNMRRYARMLTRNEYDIDAVAARLDAQLAKRQERAAARSTTRKSKKTKTDDDSKHKHKRHSKTPSVATDSSSDSESDSSNSALRARINTIAPEDRKMRSCLWKLTMRGYVKNMRRYARMLTRNEYDIDAVAARLDAQLAKRQERAVARSTTRKSKKTKRTKYVKSSSESSDALDSDSDHKQSVPVTVTTDTSISDAKILFIDANNIMYAISAVRKLAIKRKHIHEAEALLLDLIRDAVAEFANIEQVFVVFDRCAAHLVCAEHGFYVLNAHSQDKMSADDLLVDLASSVSTPASSIAITSDRELRSRLATVGVASIKSGQLFRQ
eukprot:CAMPEP_0202507074 /NCGR_PEP_ID=MMETSP1361-20130828/51530_1 /ASSEMBLY_ACC=CAM_ASM_000849 /TAXON_ID=210615 /ORGANISM="Staurosira complex sp., Strain CCMP2646" /LENGTH=528 /DNA_ID=CAMNT_0049141171 /DNA_START=12 /DNA_END=1598 /DNA_ORIENTATION=-